MHSKCSAYAMHMQQLELFKQVTENEEMQMQCKCRCEHEFKGICFFEDAMEVCKPEYCNRKAR